MNSLHAQRFRRVLVHLLVTGGVVLLLGAFTALPALAADAEAASLAHAQIHLPKSPLSGSVLVARAIHSHKLRPASHSTRIVANAA